MRSYSGLVYLKSLNMHSCTTEVGKLNTIISQPPLQLGFQVWSDARTDDQMHALETFTWSRVWQHRAWRQWCDSGAGNCSCLSNPPGSFPMWQAASWLFQKQQLLWQPSLVMWFLEAQPRFCFFSPLKISGSYLFPMINRTQFNS